MLIFFFSVIKFIKEFLFILYQLSRRIYDGNSTHSVIVTATFRDEKPDLIIPA